MNRLSLAIVLLLVAVVSATAGWWIRGLGRGSGFSKASEASDVEVSGVRALGRLEPAGGVIDLRAPMGDQLATLLVEEGQPVKKGKELARLASYALHQLEVESLQYQQNEAQQRGKAEIELADQRIQAARAALAQAKLNHLDVEAESHKASVLTRNEEVAKNDLGRLAGLRRGLVSEQEREHQDLAVRKATAELQASQTTLTKARQSSELGVAAATAELAAAESAREVAIRSIPGESLKKKLELAEAQRDRSILRAPTDGTVLAIFAREGESIGQTPVLQMANLDRMAVIAEVYEADVKRIRPGQPVTVESRSFRAPFDKQKLRGAVKHLGNIVARPRMRELDPLAPMDRRTVEVRIELDRESSKAAAGFVHMQVDVIFPIQAP